MTVAFLTSPADVGDSSGPNDIDVCVPSAEYTDATSGRALRTDTTFRVATSVSCNVAPGREFNGKD